MELKGKKIYGFKFEANYLAYASSMDAYIGEIGLISEVNDRDVCVKFSDTSWFYPKQGIEKHFVKSKKAQVAKPISQIYEIY